MYTPPKRTEGQGSNRADRLFQILVALLWNEYECNQDDPQYVGTYKVAELIGMKPSGHLRGMLHELWRQGYIEYNVGNAKNGAMREEWCLSQNLYAHPRVHEIYEHARHIRENQRKADENV